MKKWNVLAAVLAAGMIMAGCGQGASQESTVYITVKMYPCSGGTDTGSPEL